MTSSSLLVVAVVAFSTPGVLFATPQSATTTVDRDASVTATEDLRWYRVSANNAFVRSDASATVAYPIGKVPQGTVLAVVEERFGWARVRGGDALGTLHGFLPAETAAVSEDGRHVVVSVRTPLKAANLAAREDPARSWKEVARVSPGDRLALVETVGSGGDSFHKVVLPSDATAWINLAFLSPATPEEIAAANPTPEPEVVVADADSADAGKAAEVAPAIVGTDRPTRDLDGVDAADIADLVEPEVVAEEVLVDIETLDPNAATPPLAEPRLEDLESIWTRISEAPDAPAADVEELRGRYVALASSESSTASVRARAKLRVEQIAIQQQIQDRLAELRRMQERNLMNLQAIRDVREVIESRSDYEAVGRLNTSLVYDGRRLPLLYRLQEAGEGATVAYLVPTSDFRLAELTGELVGVDGVVRYDEALRLNIITPDRVDVLKESSP